MSHTDPTPTTSTPLDPRVPWVQEIADMMVSRNAAITSKIVAEELARSELQLRQYVHDRIEVALADHLSSEHPLGQLSDQIDAAVASRLQQLARVFMRAHGVELLLRATEDADAWVDQQLAELAEQEDEATA